MKLTQISIIIQCLTCGRNDRVPRSEPEQRVSFLADARPLINLQLHPLLLLVHDSLHHDSRLHHFAEASITDLARGRKKSCLAIAESGEWALRRTANTLYAIPGWRVASRSPTPGCADIVSLDAVRNTCVPPITSKALRPLAMTCCSTRSTK